MENSNLYFDTAATTPIDREVAQLINKINIENFGNPSSIHSMGQKSHNIIERSRLSISNILNCKTSEIIFTSGGSESNNIVLKGILSKGDHLITSTYEHPSILNLAKQMLNREIEVTFIKPNKDGTIDKDKIESAIKKNTKLISIMYVNNELGTINPIQTIGNIAHKHNILFHSDAVQFIGKEKLDVDNLKIDFLSMCAHKFYGPKGIGSLYCKNGIRFKPLIDGGGQENGLRAGTENISSIAGMCKALEIANDNYKNIKEKILKLEKHFIDLLMDFKNKKKNIAIAVDEWGGTSGLVTLEDVIEEVVGEVGDPYDHEEYSFRKISKGHYIVEGAIKIYDLEENIDIHFPDIREYDTLAGYILDSIGDIPKEGEKVNYGEYIFKVIKLKKNRIDQVEIKRNK